MQMNSSNAVVILARALLLASGSAEAQQPARETAREFYAWYVRPVARDGGGLQFERAVSARREFFSARLLAALDSDRAAQANVPDAIVGLDFDPLTASQDPCEDYVPDAVEVLAEDRVLVAVREHCSEGSYRPLPLKLDMVRVQGAWRVADIVYRDGDGLTAILSRYRASRESRAARPPANDAW